jgi:hypothetical protein
MQNFSIVFKSNFNYNHRVEYKKFLNTLKIDSRYIKTFNVSHFPPGGTFSVFLYFRAWVYCQEFILIIENSFV